MATKRRRKRATTDAAPLSTTNVGAGRTLSLYHLAVKVDVGEVLHYWVRAPTQCSAVKHTALRPEVTNILRVQMLTVLPDGVTITFETDKDCP